MTIIYWISPSGSTIQNLSITGNGFPPPSLYYLTYSWCTNFAATCSRPPGAAVPLALPSPSSAIVCVDCVWNVMAHAQKTDFVFRRNGRVHLNRRGRQFSRLLAAEMYASAVVMLDTPCSEVVWRVLATHSIRQFPLHFPSRASPCAIRFQTLSIYTSRSGKRGEEITVTRTYNLH